MNKIRIKRIVITKLFGMFNHDINLDVNENITAIHGPNGAGKTTILRLINDVFMKNLKKVASYQFESLTIQFADKQFIRIVKNTTVNRSELIVTFKGDKKQKTFISGDLTWGLGLEVAHAIPEDYINLIDTLPVYFIPAQRIFANPLLMEAGSLDPKRIFENTIENCSNEMAAIFGEIIRESKPKAAALDTVSLGNISAEKITREKERVSKKIELLMEIINTRFLHKTLYIDETEGFIFLSNTNQKIPLLALSTGEQHEVVLIFELLFKAPCNSLILIDEPELYFHETWQLKMLDDLEKVSEMNNVHFIIATHSRAIVRKLQSKSVEDIFTGIYRRNIWGGAESVSGQGSGVQHTRVLINELPALFNELNILTMLDIPCGDFHWMKDVDLNNIDYTGADIVKELIQKNTAKYERDGIRFQYLNLLKDKLQKVDMIFCRDCLVHFSFADISLALENVCNSQSKYFLTTTFTGRRENFDINTGRWHPINLEIMPFGLPKPIKLLYEECMEDDGAFRDKALALWKISDIKDSLTMIST